MCPSGTLANPDVAAPSSVLFECFSLFVCYFGPIYVFLALLPIKAKEQNWQKTYLSSYVLGSFLLGGKGMNFCRGMLIPE